MKLSHTVASGVPGLELDEKFECSLIWTFLEAHSHLFPMVPEDVRASTTWLVTEPAIRFRPNDDTARAGGLTPEADPADERLVLLAGESAWELDAQLLEELHRVDVGEFFQSAARDRPHHAQRLDAGLARLRVDWLRLVRCLRGRGGGYGWARQLERGGRSRNQDWC